MNRSRFFFLRLTLALITGIATVVVGTSMASAHRGFAVFWMLVPLALFFGVMAWSAYEDHRWHARR